jgi:hypothetical protein
MVEMCVSGFLVTSVAVSILLWRALAAAKRADFRLPQMDELWIRMRRKVHLTNVSCRRNHRTLSSVKIIFIRDFHSEGF